MTSASHTIRANRLPDFMMRTTLPWRLPLLRSATALYAGRNELARASGPAMGRRHARKRSISVARVRYSFARAWSASLTSIFRNSPGLVTRSGKSSRSVVAPACISIPSGSQPVHRQSAVSAPSSLVA